METKINPETIEFHLQTITQDLEVLKDRLIRELSQEVEQLQARKFNLKLEVEALELKRQQQLFDQQELAQQMAQMIVAQIQKNLSPGTNSESADPIETEAYQDNLHLLLSTIDATLRNTFQTLQQDLYSYQSSLAQQLGQMYALEQQGEAILEALVNRIKGELENDLISYEMEESYSTELPESQEISEDNWENVPEIFPELPGEDFEIPSADIPLAEREVEQKTNANSQLNIAPQLNKFYQEVSALFCKIFLKTKKTN